MRTFQGAFHNSPDYMHWYGWAPLKETDRRITDEAARLRAEAEKEAAVESPLFHLLRLISLLYP